MFTTWHTSVKARNLAASPEASLVVQDPEPPYDYVTVEGQAEVLDDLGECRRIAMRSPWAPIAPGRSARGTACRASFVVRIRPRHLHAFARVADGRPPKRTGDARPRVCHRIPPERGGVAATTGG